MEPIMQCANDPTEGYDPVNAYPDEGLPCVFDWSAGTADQRTLQELNDECQRMQEKGMQTIAEMVQTNIDTRESLNKQVEQVESDLEKLAVMKQSNLNWSLADLVLAGGYGFVVGVMVSVALF